ncbi:NAD(P)H-dependent flavin oxidoreductase [Ornithinibacillus salinisoli]|uniref:Probable nitronate monooxygenase n=1 Tax=Ornithinibacillus salinisoli TaxID=1848459 RepID=A0ABW4VX57_9BACI
MHNICDLLHISYPIIQGGMGNISNAQLTAAVSEAGGLGTIGCGTMSPEEVENIIITTKQLTDKPFAINIAINVTPFMEELITMVIKHDIPVISLSAGNPTPYISRLHEHNMKVIAIVASVKHAQKAEAAGADILVAEGFEAAGLNSNLELTTFTLIPQIVQQVQVPIVAAGGIGDGKGLAAAMMLGASGVQIGTRLIATKEAPFHESYKQKLLNADGTDAIIVGRSVGRARRIIKSEYANKLHEIEGRGMTVEEYNKLTSEDQHMLGALQGDMENGFINGGQVAGLIQDVLSVEELINGMIIEANVQMNNARAVLSTFHTNIQK